MTTNPRSPAFDAEKRQLMCAVCFEWTSFDELYVDEEGQAWDACNPCGEAEAKHYPKSPSQGTDRA